MKDYIKGLDGNVKIALAVAGVVFLWMISGAIFSAEPHKKEIQKGTALKSVTVKNVKSELYSRLVKVTGRTTPYKHSHLAAQTEGTIKDVKADVGSIIKAGETIITINMATRNEQLKAAKASLDEAKVLYISAKKLNKQGFKADTSLASRAAALANAKEALARVEQDISYTKISSSIDGVVERRLVDSGDYVGIGDKVLEVVNRNKFLLKANVSQQNVGKIKSGQTANAMLANGQEVKGIVTFVATHADEATKTYPIEIEIDGKTYQIPTGMTAKIVIPTEEIKAHLVPTASLVLGDDGTIGIMTVNKENKTKFNNIEILDMPKNGVWISGISGDVNVIVRGQTAVVEDEIVEIVSSKEK